MVGHLSLESRLVHRHALFAANQGREIQGESKCVIQFKRARAGNNTILCFTHCGVQAFQPRLEGAQEGTFFLGNHLRHQGALAVQFWEGLAHGFLHHRDQMGHKGFPETQIRIAVADRSAQNAANDIARPARCRQLAVGNGKGHGTDVVGNHPEGDVNALLLAIFASTELGKFVQIGLEHIRVIVGRFAFYGAHQALESHTGIHVLCGQRHQGTVRLSLKLHEDQIPDFNDLGVVRIDQVGPSLRTALRGGT